MWGAVRGFVIEANRLPPSPLRKLKATLLAAAAALIAPTELAAQSVPTIWNNYAGSTSVQFTYSDYALNGGTSVATTGSFPGVPQLMVQGANGGTALNFTMDTGSMGIVVSQGKACESGLIQCNTQTSGGMYNGTTTVGPGSPFLGYYSLAYTSNAVTNPGNFVGFYINATVTINGANSAKASAQVPIFVATQLPTGISTWTFMGIGHNGTNTTISLSSGLSGSTPVGSTVGTLYPKNINPFLNLTSLTPAGSAPVNLSSIAPGYAVTSGAVYLGLSSASIAGATLIALSPLAQSAASQVSSFATSATSNDWMLPSMLTQISNSTQALNGNYYGTTKVDTGIGNSIIKVVPNPSGGAPVNQALITSNT